MNVYRATAHNGFSVDIEAVDEGMASEALDAMLVGGLETGEALWPEDFDFAIVAAAS